MIITMHLYGNLNVTKIIIKIQTEGYKSSELHMEGCKRSNLQIQGCKGTKLLMAGCKRSNL